MSRPGDGEDGNRRLSSRIDGAPFRVCQAAIGAGGYAWPTMDAATMTMTPTPSPPQRASWPNANRAHLLCFALVLIGTARISVAKTSEDAMLTYTVMLPLLVRGLEGLSFVGRSCAFVHAAGFGCNQRRLVGKRLCPSSQVKLVLLSKRSWGGTGYHRCHKLETYMCRVLSGGWDIFRYGSVADTKPGRRGGVRSLWPASRSYQWRKVDILSVYCVSITQALSC